MKTVLLNLTDEDYATLATVAQHDGEDSLEDMLQIWLSDLAEDERGWVETISE